MHKNDCGSVGGSGNDDDYDKNDDK